jgi:hypothetical protein
VKQWCLAPTHDAAFVAAMEDVLDVYERPYDALRPVVCMDETSKQLVSHTRTPIPATPSHPALVDHEYRREGVANLFLFVEPLAGQRHVTVTAHRTKTDWAHAVREVVDGCYPDAERVVLVLDNLNTHTIAALYEAFPAAEAHRLARRLELHYTPKHGSWLNMAEIELSVLTLQCLKRRISSTPRLSAEVAAWQHQRNACAATITWHFTTADARLKLRHLYPAL